MINISERLKNYLDDSYIQSLINSNEYEKLYKAINYDIYGELTSLLFKIGVNPLNHLKYIPNDFCKYTKDIHRITIPANITGIGNSAFYNSAIDYMFIPDNIIYCERAAFAYCHYLKTVYIGAGLKDIPQDMFYKCKNLTNITLGINVKTIRSGAFRYCPNLTTIYYHGTIKEYSKIGVNSIDSFDLDKNHKLEIKCNDGIIKLF